MIAFDKKYKIDLLFIKKILIALCVLTGILYNTAIVNFSASGIPISFLAISLGVPLIFVTNNKFEKNILILLCFLLLILSSSVLLQIIFIQNNTSSTLFQFLYRSLLIVYSIVCYFLFKSGNKYFVIKVSILILKFAIIYGLYEIFAKNFGLPLFLNWIANNNSFTIVDNSQGWIKIARIRSFWSEPSMSAWPIIVFLFFNWKYSKRSYYTILWHLLAGIYSLFTLSRIVILIYVLTTLLIVLWTFAQKITVGGHYLKKVLLLEKKVFQIGLVSFTFLLFSLWPFYSKIIFDDLSASGRSNSIMIGYYIWLDNPLLGTGFNSYKRFDENYRFKVSNYQDEPISQSEFSSYLQQMGILGLFFIVLIGALIYLFSKYSSFDRFLILLLYAVFCSVAVGVFYFSIFWFFLAVLISNDKTYKYK